MGTLLYGHSGTEIAFDDRALAHLQIVITAKLRRREGFVFSWTGAPGSGNGRSAIWLDPSSTLFFRYLGSRPPVINREWIEVLAASSNNPGGLVFTTEPEPSTDTSSAR
ncbi:MAG: ATP-dependent DNA ligase [Rhodoglobus sp.]